MAPTVDPELKRQAEENAASRTEWERQRIDYYRSLRYEFQVTSVDQWLNSYYEQRKASYRPQKNPSWNQIRKDAGVGFFENIFAFISEDKKKTIAVRREKSRKKLQAQVDAANKREYEQCQRHNTQLDANIRGKLVRLMALDPLEVQDYFRHALERDSYLLDGSEYPPDFNLKYVPERKRLVLDYKLPTMDHVSRIKEWKVGKNNEISPKELNKTDYLEMYERVLFDLSVRAVGIVFESDTRNVIEEVVFNGSCVYSDWQSMPTMILSFLVPKSSYASDRIRSMDFVSKIFISKLEQTAYLDNLANEKAPTDLWETPPSKLVVPIQSSF